MLDPFAPASAASCRAHAAALAAPARRSGPLSPYPLWEQVTSASASAPHCRRLRPRRVPGARPVDAPIACVIAVNNDAGHRTEWMSQCSSSYLVEQSSERVQLSVPPHACPGRSPTATSLNRGELVSPRRRSAACASRSRRSPTRACPRSAAWMPPCAATGCHPRRRRAGDVSRVSGSRHPGGSLPDWIANPPKRLPSIRSSGCAPISSAASTRRSEKRDH